MRYAHTTDFTLPNASSYSGPEEDQDPRSETHETDSNELAPTLHDTDPCSAPDFETEARITSYISNLDAHMDAIRRANTRKDIRRPV